MNVSKITKKIRRFNKELKLIGTDRSVKRYMSNMVENNDSNQMVSKLCIKVFTLVLVRLIPRYM
jgi:hypothetical protein